MSAPTRAEQKEQRFERWILTIAEHLKASGAQSAPRYEGQRGSDTLLLDVATVPGLGQLRVHRRGKGALLVVMTESAAVARVLSSELERLARTTSRLANAKRKFVRRLARIEAADVFGGVDASSCVPLLREGTPSKDGQSFHRV